MGYYGIKNLKIIQLENGKFNVSCDYYDSNIYDHDYKRIWHHSDKFNLKDTETREETEFILFKDFLDGNLHGASGKFTCLEWGKNTVKLSEKEEQFLKRLNDNFWNKYKETQKYDTRNRERYDKIRYALYYRAWKKYLKDKKENSFILKYKNDYVTKISARKFYYSSFERTAKIFKGLPNQHDKVQFLLNNYKDEFEVVML